MGLLAVFLALFDDNEVKLWAFDTSCVGSFEVTARRLLGERRGRCYGWLAVGGHLCGACQVSTYEKRGLLQ